MLQGRLVRGERFFRVLYHSLRSDYHFFYAFSVLPRGKDGSLQEGGQVNNVFRRPCFVAGHGNGDSAATTFTGRRTGGQRLSSKRFVGISYGYLALSILLNFFSQVYTKYVCGDGS